jgi:hypothetical protein
MAFALAAPRSQTAVGIAIVLAGAMVVAAAYVAGRQHSREAAAAETLAIQTENKSFCSGLGFRSESELFARCVNGLTDIRQHARERLEEQAASLL